MALQKKAPKVGEVVRSGCFVSGFKRDEHGIWVGNDWSDIDLDLVDASRASAKYVVESNSFVPSTAGTAECRLVQARRLRDDDSFDPDGEGIVFYMESDWRGPYVDKIEVVGQMRSILTFEKID